MTDDIPDFTPVNLLTGFLGSGKTTLLKRILADPVFADTAVIINEFGEIGLDHLLLESVAEDVVLLPSGCLCCALKGELAKTLRDLHARRKRGDIPPFRRVLVESTGLADPYPILSTLKADAVLRHHFRVGLVITTVDAVNGAATLEQHRESQYQVAVADHLVLTKADIAPARAIDDVTLLLADLNSSAEIFDGRAEGFRPGDLLTGRLPLGGWFRASREEAGARDEGRHGGNIRTVVATVDQPIDWTVFGLWLTMLINRYGARILRVKGLLALSDEPRPVAIHAVQHLVHPPEHLAGWPDNSRHSRLIFIVDGLDETLIQKSFRAFLSLSMVFPA